MQTYPPGTRIGQYEIASRPMIGGMGVVYFALDHGNDGRPVALKTFRPELLPDRAARDRFLREGTAWVELGSHPHIVRCYEVEYIEPVTFIILELIAKEQNMPEASLRSWLIPGRPLPLEQTLLFALQIARGMQYATEKIPGFVHRDLKPENILVGADKLPGTNINRLRVTDFGLVKTAIGIDISAKVDNEETKLTQVQFTRGIGTPLYMAPEQWEGEPIGIFTDIYAFGCILYEMLTGNRTVEGNTISELHSSHCLGNLRALPTNLPKDIVSLVTKCVSVKPNLRYSSWNEVVNELELICSMLPGHLVLPDIGVPDWTREENKKMGWSSNAIGLSYLAIQKAYIAEKYFEKALLISRETNDRRGEAAALGNLGITYERLENRQRAIEYLEKQLEVAEEIGDREVQGNAFSNLGITLLHLGDVKRAIYNVEKGLQLYREINDPHGEAKALCNMGQMYENLSDLKRAIEYYEKAMLILRQTGNWILLGSVLGSLGNAFTAVGNPRQGIEYLFLALEVARENGNRDGEEAALSGLGIVYLDVGESQRAIQCFEQSLTISRELNDRRGQVVGLGNLGNVYLTVHEVRQAIGLYQEALMISREIGDRRAEASNLGNLGTAFVDIDDLPLAIDYYKQALVIAREIGNRSGEATDLCGLGNAYAAMGDIQKAVDAFEQALVLRREIGDIKGLATDLINMAEMYTREGEITRALPLAQEAAEVFARLGHPGHIQRAQKLVMQLHAGGVRSKANLAQEALGALPYAANQQSVEKMIERYPFMTEEAFIRAVARIIAEQVPTDLKPAFEQRLAWLRQIATQK